MKPFNFLNTDNDREIAEQFKTVVQITRDDSAREKMRAHLSEYAKMRPIRTVPKSRSPQKTFFSYFSAYSHSLPALAALILVVAGGSSLIGAQGSLPGDVLYPIKINISEGVQSSLTFSPQAKAQWNVELAERRLEEAASLSIDGSLTEAARADINASIDSYVAVAEANKAKLETTSDITAASDVSDAIESIRFARADVLEQQPTNAVATIASTMAAPTEVATMKISAPPQGQTDLTVAPEPHMGARMQAQPMTMSAVQADTSVENPVAHSRVAQTAARVRIEAIKKFLDRTHRKMSSDVQTSIDEQLKKAEQAFSLGNFSDALEAAINLQKYISENSASRR